MRISRSLQRVRGPVDPATGHRSGRLVELPPKTAASAASLALPDTLVTALRQHHQDQLRERLQARVWIDDGLVFTSSIGTYLEPRNIDRTWKALLVRAGVRPLRIHDLRHATATVLLTEGVDMKVIQRTLRHSRHQTTADIYTHVAEKLQRGAAESMDAVLRRAPEHR